MRHMRPHAFHALRALRALRELRALHALHTLRAGASRRLPRAPDAQAGLRAERRGMGDTLR